MLALKAFNSFLDLTGIFGQGGFWALIITFNSFLDLTNNVVNASAQGSLALSIPFWI